MLFLALLVAGLPAGGQTIANPSFEADTFTVFPGYVSGNSPITGWTENVAGRVGLNPGGGSPFANNGTIPDGVNVAILQASGGEQGTLTTSVTGLTPGTTYLLSFFANARSQPDPVAALQVSVDGIGLNLYDAAGAPFPALVTAGSYQAVHGMFTASAASEDLVVANNMITGDHTLLVDDFTITAVTAGPTIANPGFETDTFTVFPGYISGNSAITGWTENLAHRVGLNPGGGSPFANNGTIPEGVNVALLQAGSPEEGSLSTTVTGLTPGAKYNVSFRTNARNGNTPYLTFSTDGAGASVTASGECRGRNQSVPLCFFRVRGHCREPRG